jgi:hypothetical protein
MTRIGMVFLLLLVLTLPVMADEPQMVGDEAQAHKVFVRARAGLGALGLTIPREIPLKFRTRDELMVENNGTGGRTIELDGFYRPYNPEEVWIVSGLPYGRTLGAMAHELTHAWQTTESPMQDRKLQEGFAMWVEYKVLVADGFPSLASRLTRSSDPDYGGGLRYLLEVEQKKGTAGVLEIARTKTSI